MAMAIRTSYDKWYISVSEEGHGYWQFYARRQYDGRTIKGNGYNSKREALRESKYACANASNPPEAEPTIEFLVKVK